MKSDAEAFQAEHPDSSEQEQNKRFRRRILTMVAAFLLVCLVLWACAVVSASIEAKKRSNGYFTYEVWHPVYQEVE